MHTSDKSAYRCKWYLNFAPGVISLNVLFYLDLTGKNSDIVSFYIVILVTGTIRLNFFIVVDFYMVACLDT